MSRLSRKESASGTYHVMIRGVNKQAIFNDDIDRTMFVKLLKETKGRYNFELLAWCLMPNHVHLVPRFANMDGDPSGISRLASTMKSINMQYAMYFNKKYSRCGHLFQDRFKSEVVEDDSYLFTVVRYVNQNPWKAKLVDKMDEYDWSSYQQYLFDAVERKNSRFSFADTGFVLDAMGVNEFIRFSNTQADDVCMDDE